MHLFKLFAAAGALALITGCTTAPEQPAAGAELPACGMLPNCVNSENGEGGAAIEAISASASQWQSLIDWLATQDDWDITVNHGDFVQAVATTPRMRYRDDVQLRYDTDASLIQVRSSSRLGIGDMGANRDRVEMLRTQVNNTP